MPPIAASRRLPIIPSERRVQRPPGGLLDGAPWRRPPAEYLADPRLHHVPGAARPVRFWCGARNRDPIRRGRGAFAAGALRPSILLHRCVVSPVEIKWFSVLPPSISGPRLAVVWGALDPSARGSRGRRRTLYRSCRPAVMEAPARVSIASGSAIGRWESRDQRHPFSTARERTSTALYGPSAAAHRFARHPSTHDVQCTLARKSAHP